jgi:hypothetical protein
VKVSPLSQIGLMPGLRKIIDRYDAVTALDGISRSKAFKA